MQPCESMCTRVAPHPTVRQLPTPSLGPQLPLADVLATVVGHGQQKDAVIKLGSCLIWLHAYEHRL